jgi:chemotaxis methyl-accepting protein methylase
MNVQTALDVKLSPRERGQVLELVRRRFGIRDSDYGASRIDGAVSSVLPESGCTNVASLIESAHEQNSPRWLFDLVEHLTVGETYFLREPAQIMALRQTILPDAIERRAEERRLRMWSAGCSTGEEVYTLAMLLTERNLTQDWDVTLVGTDVNRESLRLAREARYPAWSFRATSDAVRERYFEPAGNDWRVRESLRSMARFAWLNLAADPLLPPIVGADLITCRNVTIYFDDASTQRLYRTLVGALAPGGWLMLGPSDPMPADTRGLECVPLTDAVLWRRVADPRPERPKPVVPERPKPMPTPAPRLPVHAAGAPPESGAHELEAGLLALEASSVTLAVQWLRRAAFLNPDSALAHFGLGRAYVALGDRPRAHAVLLHTRRLLLGHPGDEVVPGGDSLTVETLRQTVASYIEDLSA